MKSTNWIPILVLGALVAWQGLELYRLNVATRQLSASIQLRESVEAKLDATRVKYAQANLPN